MMTEDDLSGRGDRTPGQCGSAAADGWASAWRPGWWYRTLKFNDADWQAVHDAGGLGATDAFPPAYRDAPARERIIWACPMANPEIGWGDVRRYADEHYPEPLAAAVESPPTAVPVGVDTGRWVRVDNDAYPEWEIEDEEGRALLEGPPHVAPSGLRSEGDTWSIGPTMYYDTSARLTSDDFEAASRIIRWHEEQEG